MFLQKVIYIFLLFMTITAAAPTNDHPHLPSLRLSRVEVEKMKRTQSNPPGTFYRNITMGKGDNKTMVPVVEINFDILCDDEDGHRARSLAPRGSCYSRQQNSAVSDCNVAYCWKDTSGNTYNEFMTLQGSDGQGNPTRVFSSNDANLQLNPVFNDGVNGWFEERHECSNDNTMMWTNHRWNTGVMGLARVDHVECDTCDFGGLFCQSDVLKGNLHALGNGINPDIGC
jgi:hypothetical protein